MNDTKIASKAKVQLANFISEMHFRGQKMGKLQATDENIRNLKLRHHSLSSI